MLKSIAALCLAIGLLGSPIAQAQETKVCITQVEILNWLHAEPGAIPSARLRSRLTGPLAQQFAAMTGYPFAALARTVYFFDQLGDGNILALVGNEHGCILLLNGETSSNYTMGATKIMTVQYMQHMLRELGINGA